MDQLGVSDAIRFVLIGFVGFFCYAFLYPLDAASYVEDIGGIPLTGCAMAGGAVFFFLYDALLLPRIHWFKDLIGTAEETYRVRLKHLCPEYKLSSGDAEYIYVSILRNKIPWKDVPDLVILTSGVHLLYMSSILLTLFSVIGSMGCTARPIWPLWLTAVLVFFAGLILDRRAERTETALLFGVEDSLIRQALEHAFPARMQNSGSE